MKIAIIAEASGRLTKAAIVHGLVEEIANGRPQRPGQNESRPEKVQPGKRWSRRGSRETANARRNTSAPPRYPTPVNRPSSRQGRYPASAKM